MRSILIAVIDHPGPQTDTELYQQLLSLADWQVAKDCRIQVEHLPCVF